VKGVIMKKWKMMLVVFVLGCLLVAGCITETDPDTGKKTHRLDPNAAATIGKTADAGISILTIAGALWPALLPIVGALGGVYGAWKKINPKYLAAKTEAELYYGITESAVMTITDFKEEHPELWGRLKDEYWSNVISPEAENVIRALRGLPAKDV